MEYRCKKCGATGESKCAMSRTMFPDWESPALCFLENCCHGFPGDCEKELDTFTLGFRYTSVKHALEAIRSLSEEGFKQFMCKHAWSPTHDYECCVGHQHKAGE